MSALAASLTDFVTFVKTHLTGDEKGEAAEFMDRLFRALVRRGEDRTRAQRFVLQLLVALASEDTQIAGDVTTLHIHNNSRKRPKVPIERAPDPISPADQKRVSDWIKNLAEESTGKNLGELDIFQTS